ncbi:MAG: tetratricopeptide repeat protein [Desulfobacula sp.]
MKKNLIYIIFLSAFIFHVTGCAPLDPDRAQQGPQKTGKILATGEDKDLSANYYYLESRLHIKNNEFDKAVISLEKALALDPESYAITWDLVGLYLRHQETEKALASAEKLVRLNPESIDGLMLLIELKKDSLDEKELLEKLNKVLSLDPENKEAFLRLGKLYLEKEEYQKAQGLFEKMAEQFPDYYVAIYYLGEAYMNQKDYVRAKTQFLRSIEIEPDLVESRFQLIEILSIEGRAENNRTILDYYKEILDIDPDNEQAEIGMALHYYKNKLVTEAREIFTRLGRKIEKNTKIAVVAIEEYISKKKFKDAVIIFSEMLKADPENSTLNFFAGMAHEANDDFKTAIARFKKIKPDHPQYKKAVIRIAYLYKQLGENQAAVEYLEEKIIAYPKDIDMITYLASVFEKDGHFEKAFNVLNKGLEDSPDNTSLLFKLGAVQDKADLKDESILTMKKIIQLDPEDAGALNYLGYSYADKGIFLDEALSLIEKAYKLKPGDGYIIDSLGWVYYKRGDYDKAVEYLEKAAELSSFETIISDHLGDAYQKVNRPKDALEIYKKALSNAREEDKELVSRIQKKIKTIEKQLK